MVVKIEMTAEDVSNEVRRYSIIVGFLLVAIFVIPCVAFALLSKYCQKQRRKRRQPTVTSLLHLQHKSSVFMRGVPIPEEEPTLTGTKDSSSESTTTSVTSYGPLGQVECPLDNLKGLEKMIPMGTCLSCLDMWKVKIPSAQWSKHLTGTLVLVKKISALDAKSHIPCLKADIATLSRIPPHPLLLNLIGVCNSGSVPQAIMTEYPVHGRLHSFLVVKRKCMLSGNSQLWNGWVQRNSEGRVAEAVQTNLSALSPLLADIDTRCHPYSQPLNSRFTNTDLLLFALQIGSAMDHLIQRNVLHKGLSSENLVIGSEFYLKLTGVYTDNANRHKEPSMRQLRRTASGRNLFKWDAPEVMEMGQHTEKTEVWRFGMTVWEVSSMGDVPFTDIPNRTLSGMIKNGQRPQAPESCPERLYQLMMECWNLNPNLRPTFSTIVETVRSILSSEGENWESVDDVDSLSLEADSEEPASRLLHRRPPCLKKPFLHSNTCPELPENVQSPYDSPSAVSLPAMPVGSLSVRRTSFALDLEEIPESHTESEA